MMGKKSVRKQHLCDNTIYIKKKEVISNLNTERSLSLHALCRLKLHSLNENYIDQQQHTKGNNMSGVMGG